MDTQTMIVEWSHPLLQLSSTDEYLQVIREALRLSVARVGCVPVVCRVTPFGVWLMIQYTPHDHDDASMLIDWVRAAARFAVTAYAHTSPPWDEPYTARMVPPDAIHREIVASMHGTLMAIPHAPSASFE